MYYQASAQGFILLQFWLHIKWSTTKIKLVVLSRQPKYIYGKKATLKYNKFIIVYNISSTEYKFKSQLLKKLTITQ